MPGCRSEFGGRLSWSARRRRVRRAGTPHPATLYRQNLVWSLVVRASAVRLKVQYRSKLRVHP